jgi:hypothetical protein
VAAHVVVWAVSAHAVLMVLLTRLRLGGYHDAARRIDIGRAVVTTHTTGGAGAALLWLAWLLDDAWFTAVGRQVVGASAVALWWLVAGCGLLILARWMPSHGVHADSAVADSWSRGPWLSIVAHVPVVLDVAVLTWAVASGTR